MRQAVILVGGRGMRLGALASDLPKPLLPIVGDMRFIDYLIDNLARHGFEDIVLLAGHLAHAVEARYAGIKRGGAQVRVISEPAPAGTAGALRYAADILDETFLVTNGDSIVDFNYLALTQALGPNDVGALAVREVEDAARYGRVEINDGRVASFHEKDPAFAGAAYISGGVYALRRRVLARIKALPCSIETDVFPQLAAEGALTAHIAEGYFIDIGLPDTLAQARTELPAKMRRSAVFFDRDGTLIRDNGYTHNVEDLAWLPGAIEAVRRCNDAGRLAIVVTNQAGIARGYYTEAQMRAFHTAMQAQLRSQGAHIDAFYHCPYHEDGAIARYAKANHPDRKPSPGMLRRALIEWPIARDACFLVGDSDLDVEAARAAGVPAEKVVPGELAAAVARALARPPAATTAATPVELLAKRAACAERWLFDAALPLWWRHGFDRESGCFHERLTLDGAPSLLPRRVRVQARQVVVYARAGRLGWSGPWRKAVEAGVRVLLERCLRGDGGTRHLLDLSGAPIDERRDLYDLAFVLLALGEAYTVLDAREDLLDAAEQLAAWADAHWAHAEGGYREGDITPTPPRRQNPHMHMFEAFLSLYEACGRGAYLERANRIGNLFKEKLFNAEYGALPEYFDDAWRPLPGEEGRIVEPGHHLEWSWLLHRWHALGGERASEIAEQLRTHAEIYGVDLASGCTYDEIYIDGMPRTTTSRFWPHTERIKANLSRYERTGDPAAAAAAAQAFDALASYLETPTLGTWRDRRTADGGFIDEPAPASSFYHAMFAMFELLRVAKRAP